MTRMGILMNMYSEAMVNDKYVKCPLIFHHVDMIANMKVITVSENVNIFISIDTLAREMRKRSRNINPMIVMKRGLFSLSDMSQSLMSFSFLKTLY